MDHLQQVNQLLKWAEQQQLSNEQLRQASQQIPLYPLPTDWLTKANQVLLFVSALLLASALIFFFAYNWPLMHYLTKLALAGTTVALTGVLSIFSPLNSLLQRAAMLLSALFTGALLALIGQTYQTGADIWQLFAGWAVLITPLVLLSRSRASYILWLVLIELALWRYFDSQAQFWLFDSAQQLQLFTLANLLLVLFAEFLMPRLGVKRHRPLVWLAVLALLLPLTIGGIIGVWEHDYHLNLLQYLIITTMLIWRYLRWHRDVLIFALTLFSVIAFSTALLARLLGDIDSFFSINLLAMFMIGCSAGAAIWLKKLLQEAHYAK